MRNLILFIAIGLFFLSCSKDMLTANGETITETHSLSGILYLKYENVNVRHDDYSGDPQIYTQVSGPGRVIKI